VTLDGETVVSGNGLATQPGSNKLFALLTLQDVPQRLLVTIDPSTGEATRIGNTLDKFASLAFSCDGTLYGVTGWKTTGPPEYLYTLDTKGDVPPMPLFPLGDGTQGGRALAFNADNELLYYVTLDQEGTALFSVDVGTEEILPITEGNFTGPPTSATFISETVMFVASSFMSGFSEMFMMSIDGNLGAPERPDHNAKGLALVPSLCPGVIEVDIDIKPGSDPNSVNTKSKGKLPVAILTTDAFDAATVDPATVTIGDGEGDETSVAARKNGTLMANLEDVDDDGDLDMILHFDTRNIVSVGDLNGVTTSLIVNGLTLDEQAFTGADAVRVVH
jgi:hypothetical protein